jgi:hypothetical protein
MNAEDHDDDEPPAAVDVTLGLICMWSVSLVDSLKKTVFGLFSKIFFVTPCCTQSFCTLFYTVRRMCLTKTSSLYLRPICIGQESSGSMCVVEGVVVSSSQQYNNPFPLSPQIGRARTYKRTSRPQTVFDFR